MPKSKFSKCIRSLDQFGDPITFTYNGSANYKSTLGGFITILSRLGVLCFFLIQVVKII